MDPIVEKALLLINTIRNTMACGGIYRDKNGRELKTEKEVLIELRNKKEVIIDSSRCPELAEHLDEVVKGSIA